MGLLTINIDVGQAVATAFYLSTPIEFFPVFAPGNGGFQIWNS